MAGPQKVRSPERNLIADDLGGQEAPNGGIEFLRRNEERRNNDGTRMDRAA